MKRNDRFIVHSYSVQGVETAYFSTRSSACQHARSKFKFRKYYKVKVWDTDRGPVVPNVVDPPGLVLELV